MVAKEERLWVAFCKLDKDGDGNISASEVSDMLDCSLDEAKAYIKEIDIDNNGTIDYEEFTEMWMQKEKAQEAAN